MANTDLTTDLRAMHDAIVAEISAEFPVFQTVEFYREDRKEMPIPACILELEEFADDSEHDPGSGQQPLSARFCAHVVIGFRTENCRLEVRLLAAALAGFLRLKHWGGIVCDNAVVHGAFEDDFMSELDQFECWKVEWSQTVYIGPYVWDETGAVRPSTVYLGQAPDIGEGNADKYPQIYPT